MFAFIHHRNIKLIFFIAFASALFGFAFIFRIFFVKAETTIFYPESCLGGWINPHQAEGKPEVLNNTDSLNANNSAVLPENTISDIFCGSFKGKIPKYSLPQKFYLNLSWSLGRSSLSNKQIDMTADVSDALNSLGTTSPNSISSPMNESDITTATLENSSSTPVTKTNDASSLEPSIFSPEPSSPGSSETNNDISTSVSTETAPLQTEVVPITPEASPADSNSGGNSSSGSPQSFLKNIIFSTAFAAEENNLKDIASDASLSSDFSSATSSDISSSTIKIESNVNAPFLLISYTLDGVSWKELTRVGSYSTQNTFEIPEGNLSSWNDLSNLQIKIERMSTLGNEPEVMLDAMSINVEYGEDKTPTNAKSDQKRFGITSLKSSDDNLLLLSSNADIDQGNILSVRAYREGAVYFYDLDDKDFFMTSGVSKETAEFPAYQFAIGHYIILFSENPKDCEGRSMDECISLQNSIEKASFSIIASGDTPSEFVPKILPINIDRDTSVSTIKNKTSSTTKDDLNASSSVSSEEFKMQDNSNTASASSTSTE